MRVRFWRLVRPYYNLLTDFDRAPNLLPLQGFLPEPIRDPQWDYFTQLSADYSINFFNVQITQREMYCDNFYTRSLQVHSLVYYNCEREIISYCIQIDNNTHLEGYILWRLRKDRFDLSHYQQSREENKLKNEARKEERSINTWRRARARVVALAEPRWSDQTMCDWVVKQQSARCSGPWHFEANNIT